MRETSGEMQEAISPTTESELLARVLELEGEVRARDELLAVTAHELRNPMHALLLQMAAAEVIARRSGDSELIQRIARARAITDRFVKRASLILEVSRIRADRGALTLESIDLEAVVRELCDSYTAEAQFHRVGALRVNVQGHCNGHWDRLAVEQIVSNLLSNAIKYGAGADVEVSLTETRQPRGARIEVRDHGIGIAPEDAARIFERFEQVLSGERRRDGFGLGLWLVKRLVEGHGGTLAVESTLGKGSTFIAWLPVGN